MQIVERPVRRSTCCRVAQGNNQQQNHVHATQRLVRLGAIMAPMMTASGPSIAGEVSEAATDAAASTASAAAELQGPTVTFGGSFGQYDPIIAVFFYAVIAALLVLTLGVSQ